MTSNRFDFIEENVSLYADRSNEDQWFIDHNMAILCFDLVELIEEGVYLYDSICRLDNDWRVYVYKEIVPYEEEHETRICALFKSWSDTSDNIVALYERLENEYVERDFDTTIVETLRKHVREVRASQVPDEVFFCRDETFVAAEKSLAGEKVEFEEMGD